MARITSRLRATAYHEAGHAVAAWHQRIRINSLSIAEDDISKGRLSHEYHFTGIRPDLDMSPRAQRRIENMAMVCFAGPHAQRKAFPRSWRNHHGRSDFHQATDLLSYVDPDPETLEIYVKLVDARAQKFVAGPSVWMLIDRLANDLLERRKMTGREVRESIRRGSRLRIQVRPR